MTYAQWAAKYPWAAGDLQKVLGATPWPAAEAAVGKSEAWAQQQDRLTVSRFGGYAWRNNVGGAKVKEHHKCPQCSFTFTVKNPPIRWGLANDSAALNKEIKSSDLICAIPRLITQEHVGTTIAQFGSIETKVPGWKFNPSDPHQMAQFRWLELVAKIGGFATFSTGEVKL